MSNARIESAGIKNPPDKAGTRKAIAHATFGFGVPATSDPHHFVVEIPRGNTGAVTISEVLGLQAQDRSQSIIDRIVLDRPRWTAIRGEVQRAFNVRLKERNLKPSAWKVGSNPVDRLLGKELCMLAWAVEGMAFENIKVAVRNWLALRPEERWWLFGMTAMSTGGFNDGGKGWRLALRHALGDVAQTESLNARRAKAKPNSEGSVALDLFDFD